jgi:hypothetical protein
LAAIHREIEGVRKLEMARDIDTEREMEMGRETERRGRQR